MNIYTIISGLFFLAGVIAFKSSLFLALMLVLFSVFFKFFAARIVDAVLDDRWVAMKVLSCVEVFLGVLGLGFLCFFIVKAARHSDAFALQGMNWPTFFFSLLFLAFSAFLFWGGVGVFRRKPWALKMHAWGISLAVIFLSAGILIANVVGIGFAIEQGLAEKWVYFCSVVIFLNLIVTTRLLMHLAHFFRHPMVKLYFRK